MARLARNPARPAIPPGKVYPCLGCGGFHIAPLVGEELVRHLVAALRARARRYADLDTAPTFVEPYTALADQLEAGEAIEVSAVHAYRLGRRDLRPVVRDPSARVRVEPSGRITPVTTTYAKE